MRTSLTSTRLEKVLLNVYTRGSMWWIQLDCTENLGIQLQLPSASVCIFESFWYLTYKNLHKNEMHVNWHTRFRFWHVSVTCEEQNHSSIDTLQIETTRTTRHVTSRWHFRRKSRCQSTFIFALENVTWHFGFDVERQMKFVKHTQLNLRWDEYC